MPWKLTLKTDPASKCVIWELADTPRHSQQPTGATPSPVFLDENVATGSQVSSTSRLWCTSLSETRPADGKFQNDAKSVTIHGYKKNWSFWLRVCIDNGRWNQIVLFNKRIGGCPSQVWSGNISFDLIFNIIHVAFKGLLCRHVTKHPLPTPP